MIDKRIKFSRTRRKSFKMIPAIFFTFSLLFFISLSAVSAPEDESSQGERIGALIYRVSQFITWPENTFSSAEDSFRICIFGKDEYKLSEILKKESGRIYIHGRKMHVVSLPTMQSARDYFEKGGTCHLLFITMDSINRTAELTPLCGTANTLIMGESIEFLEAGGMLSLVQRKGKIRIFSNDENIKKSSLKFDSRLMLSLRKK